MNFLDRVADRVTLDIDLSDVADFVEFNAVPLDEWECATTGDVVHREQRDAEDSAGFHYQVFGREGFPPGVPDSYA